MRQLRSIGLIILIIFYILAGVNHFLHPAFYVSIIPVYIPFASTVNYLSGACEIILGSMMIFKFTRSAAGWLIIIMLAAFLPVHITMALDAPLKVGTIVVTPLLAWVRIILQPILMYWVWWNTKPHPNPLQKRGR